MSERTTLGEFVLKSLAIIVLFDFIFSMIKMLVYYISQTETGVINTFGTGWVFSPVVQFLLSVWSWIALILTNMIAFAVVIAIGLLREAFESKWS